MTTPWNVAILLFPGVEVLDFAGPFEVFSRTRLVAGPNSRRNDDSAPFRVFTVAEARAPIVATGGLKVEPEHGFDTCPNVDMLVVPGGFGTRPLLKHEPTLRWIANTAARARKVTSVCTGSVLLAKAGLLSGRRATTHWCAFDLLASVDDSILVDRDARYVDDGIVTSAGVSAGIDMAFWVVESLFGKDVADETAHYIDYPRHRESPPPEPTKTSTEA